MKNQAQITMWKALNYEYIVATIKGLEPDEALEMAEQSSYHPIDDNTCLIIGDEVALLVTRSGLIISTTLEVNPAFLSVESKR